MSYGSDPTDAGERATMAAPVDRGASRTRRRAPSRRTLLTSIVAGGALASGVGAVQAATAAIQRTEDADGEGPDPPENLQSSIPSGGISGVELSWDGPADSCATSLSHYEVERDGDHVTTVPAGVTRVRLQPSTGGDELIYGVTAVAEDGSRSPTVTVGAFVGVAEPLLRTRVIPDESEIEAGETIEANLVLQPASNSIPDLDAYAAEVSLSTPCAVEIVNVSYPDTFADPAEPDISPDGSFATVSAGGFSGDTDDEVVLATLELEARRPAATEIHVPNVLIAGDDFDPMGAADFWTTLSVADLPYDPPPTPGDLSVTGGPSQTVDISWDGVDDPCGSNLSHYAITVDGSVERTVPIGINSANVLAPASGSVTIGVRTVDEAGNESFPAEATISNLGVSDPRILLSIETSESTIEPGETSEATLLLSSVLQPIPDVFDYDVEVVVSTPCAATITDAWHPGPITDGSLVSIAEDGSSVRFVVDALAPGDEYPVEIATVELTGQAEGATEIDVDVEYMRGEDPMLVWPRWRTLRVEESEALPPIGESEAPPQDLDGDGRYEDVNGNGDADFDDVVTFFEHMSDDVVQDNVDAFDFNGNGGIDFDDVIVLFDAV